jgi:hypothetical protein
MNTESYLLRWRGRQEGPYPLEALREMLEAGRIGLMHEIQVGGHWTTVDDFLQSLDRQQKAEQQARVQSRQEDQQRQLATQQALALQEVQRQNDLLVEELEDVRRQQERQPVAISNPRDFGQAYQLPPSNFPPGYPYPRTSGLAVAGFVCAVLNFVPFINFVSWVLALVFAHVALSDIQRTPGLGGRGLAIAALAITYALLILLLAAFFLGLLAGITKTHRFY